MKRKTWIVAGIVVIVLLVIGVILFLNNRSSDTVDTSPNVPVLELAYCTEQQVKPCVVSFSTDAEGRMLVNILLPDLSYPGFYLMIKRGGTEIKYNCQRVKEAFNHAYCAGGKLPPGEILHLMLISIKDRILIAEGDLSIIGLAYPTVGIAIATPQDTATMPITTSTETPAPLFVLPTFTNTPRSYPNPSYPNPSYP